MRIIDLSHPDRPFSLPRGCGLCLGHFDGVHRGHRALIEELIRQNEQREVPLPLGAVLFTTPPTVTLRKQPIPQLNTLDEKLSLLREAGLSFAALYDFPSIMHFSPSEFAQKVLFEDCDARIVVCGFNYSFGAGGKGKPANLADFMMGKEDRTLSVVPAYLYQGAPVSSSRIREMLLAGRPDEATEMLGRPYRIKGYVASGKHIGREMKTPTANLAFPQWGLIPRHGVYATKARVDGRCYSAISNVGTRPTFDDGNAVNCETFLFDFAGDLYGKEIEISFLKFIRPEQSFPSTDDLSIQIATDIETVKAFHAQSNK